MNKAPHSTEEEMHMGKQIKTVREFLGVKQASLAGIVGMTQQDISDIEKRKKVDDEVLEIISKALGVTPEVIKNFDTERILKSVVTNYNFNDNAVQNQNQQTSNDESAPTNNFNPIEKIVQLYDEKVKDLKDTIAGLQARITQLEALAKK